MLMHKVNDRVKFGPGKITGTVVGHGTMISPAGTTLLTYAIRLDEEFQGYINGADTRPYISHLLACGDGDGVTKI